MIRKGGGHPEDWAGGGDKPKGRSNETPAPSPPRELDKMNDAHKDKSSPNPTNTRS